MLELMTSDEEKLKELGLWDKIYDKGIQLEFTVGTLKSQITIDKLHNRLAGIVVLSSGSGNIGSIGSMWFYNFDDLNAKVL